MMRKLVYSGILLLLAAMLIQPVWAGQVLPGKYRIEPVATGLTHPQALAVAPDGRIFFAERTTGNVRIIKNGELLADPFATVSVSTVGEEGLLGIALHPEFADNGWVYLYYTQASPRTNRIVRFTASGNTGTNMMVILDNIGYGTALGEDNGGALAFGTDGKLYASVGVLEVDADAQNDSSLSGKVLRINDDGSVPSDNPTQGSYVWAKGFRNSAGIAVHPDLGTVYAADNYDEDAACDEVNVVTAGGNYGWNAEACGGTTYTPPLQSIDPQVTAAGLATYTGSAFPNPSVCTSGPLQDCSYLQYCSNDSAKPCVHDKVCSNDPLKGCKHDKVCSNDHTVGCTSSTDCGGASCDDYCGAGNTCISYCGSGATCEPVCGGNGCTDSTDAPLYIAGSGDRASILRDFLAGASADALDTDIQFYSAEQEAECPGAVRDVESGSDGWMYVASDDPDPAKAGIYRIVFDDFGGAKAVPREVSASPHMELTLGKSGTGLAFHWEDLKREAWDCSPGHCPPGSRAGQYTIWKGALGSFSSHAPFVQADGTDYNDALQSYTTASMPDPGEDRYFLVSARGANHEGPVGSDSDGSPRPGYAVTEICDDIGYGSPNTDLDKCTGPAPVNDDGSGTCNYVGNSYPDQWGNWWTLDDFRGKVVVLSLDQFG